MTRSHKLAIFASLLPAILGVLAALVFFVFGWLPDYVLFFRLSLGYILLFSGLLLTIILSGFFAFARAMDQRSQNALAQEQADAASQHRQFLQRLDHELKNPLTSLQLEMANLEAEESTAKQEYPQEQAQTAGRLKVQVQRLNDLVIQLRKLSELETRPIERVPVVLGEILQDLVAEFSASTEGSQRQISLNIPQVPWPLPEVSGDEDLLYLAARNVLSNAVKYTRPGDSIQVRAFEDSSWVIIEVADTGPGIPPDEQEHVWEELFRGKIARGAPGSGLGLTMVRTILERHGGQATLRSRLNKGTVVTLRIPMGL